MESRWKFYKKSAKIEFLIFSSFKLPKLTNKLFLAQNERNQTNIFKIVDFMALSGSKVNLPGSRYFEFTLIF